MRTYYDLTSRHFGLVTAWIIIALEALAVRELILLGTRKPTASEQLNSWLATDHAAPAHDYHRMHFVAGGMIALALLLLATWVYLVRPRVVAGPDGVMVAHNDEAAVHTPWNEVQSFGFDRGRVTLQRSGAAGPQPMLTFWFGSRPGTPQHERGLAMATDLNRMLAERRPSHRPATGGSPGPQRP